MVARSSKKSRRVGIHEALRSLPVFDDVYLQMQAHNLELVDGLLMEMEQSLLNEYIETESTPVQQGLFVSAISQLWIFGVYELLRTWRQRAREVLTFGEEAQKLSEQERKERISEKRRKFREAAKFAYGSETQHVKSRGQQMTKSFLVLSKWLFTVLSVSFEG
jgi:hypothetical protein